MMPSISIQIPLSEFSYLAPFSMWLLRKTFEVWIGPLDRFMEMEKHKRRLQINKKQRG